MYDANLPQKITKMLKLGCGEGLNRCLWVYKEPTLGSFPFQRKPDSGVAPGSST
jgi:hypothetical protein